MEDQKKEDVAIVSFLKKLKHDLLRYIIVFVVALVGSILIILPVPRYYKCDISLAPEMDNAEGGGKLSSIASSFGVDLGDVASGNALQPSLYPDLMKSNEFVKSLLQIPVQTKDGSVKTNYYDYLYHHQKESPYTKVILWFGKKFGDNDTLTSKTDSINPFMLNKKQDEIFTKIKKSIACDIDIKTGLITISVEDQDPLISATIADSVRAKLQDFITNYKTNKMKNDVKYYTKLVAEAKKKYENARQKYAAFSDAAT
ncbi:chain-length determining protein [Prevotella scopos]|uniref:chain-length determining protein n=1 Tax=Prevotella scopos TaxID=589437 RepID=UPI000A6DAA3F|nr:chain-length determining protein [Prevotella scopos]